MAKFFLLFLISLLVNISSFGKTCTDKGLRPYLNHLTHGTFFKNLDSDSLQTSLALALEERLLKSLGVESYYSSDLKHASRVSRWSRREDRLKRRGDRFKRKGPRSLLKIKDLFLKLFRRKQQEDTPQVSAESLQKRYLNQLKKVLIKKYVIKVENIPESFFKEKERIIRERGGDVREVQSPSGRRRLIEIIQRDQITSLSAWIDYLTLDDATAKFPTWTKLWVMEGVLKLGHYNTEIQNFGKRTKNQTAPFAELNREALAAVMSDIMKKMNLLELKRQGKLSKGESKKKLIELGIRDESDSYIDALLSGSFKRLYEKNLIRVYQKMGDTRVVEGEWVLYPRGSDPRKLTQALDEQGTGWCTAQLGMASSQIKGGDFYIYFSNDSNGKPTIPRIAIRMEGKEIAEVRGRGIGQHMDPEIMETDILERKLQEFGDKGKAYQTKTLHSKQLSEISRKTDLNQPLTLSELRFLYELDEPIKSFGYRRSPLIKEVKDKRNTRVDIAFIFGYEPHEISLSKEEILQGGIKFHFGDLSFKDEKDPKKIILPPRMFGYANLRSIESAKGLIIPPQFDGYLNLSGLTSLDHLEIPDSCSGVYLDSKFAEHPKTKNWNILKYWKSSEGEGVYGELNLEHLQPAHMIQLPQTIDGPLYYGGHHNLQELNNIDVQELGIDP